MQVYRGITYIVYIVVSITSWYHVYVSLWPILIRPVHECKIIPDHRLTRGDPTQTDDYLLTRPDSTTCIRYPYWSNLIRLKSITYWPDLTRQNSRSLLIRPDLNQIDPYWPDLTWPNSIFIRPDPNRSLQTWPDSTQIDPHWARSWSQFELTVTYCNPFWADCEGEQLCISWQWSPVSRNCLLSRNQPESAIPQTSMSDAFPPTDSTRPRRFSATRSRLSRTPVPPALQRYSCIVSIHKHYTTL